MLTLILPSVVVVPGAGMKRTIIIKEKNDNIKIKQKTAIFKYC